MKRQLSGGVVTGVLVVTGIVIAMFAWKALAPPAAPEPARITKQMMDAHNSSAAEIRADQKRRAAAALAAAGGNH